MLGSLAAILIAPALSLLGPSTPARAEADPSTVKHWEWGSITAASGKLRKGCRKYTYSWSLQPPEGDWGLELFLIDPDGKKIGSAAQLVGVDPLQGSGVFTICKAVTRHGRFHIRGLLSVQNGPDEYVEGWVEPASFSLRKK
jgi:hypothetical protein